MFRADNTAQGQFGVTLPTEWPMIGDLIFFEGTYDKNNDGLKDAGDGITHVGITIGHGYFVHAPGSSGVGEVGVKRITTFSKFAGYRYPKEYVESECKDKDSYYYGF